MRAMPMKRSPTSAVAVKPSVAATSTSPAFADLKRAEQRQVVRRAAMAGDGHADHDGFHRQQRLDAIVQRAAAAQGIDHIAGRHIGEGGNLRRRRPRESCGGW